MPEELKCANGHSWRPKSPTDSTCPSCGHTAVTVLQPNAEAPVRAARAGWPPSIDGYELLDKINSGGMGEVWRARHRKLQRIDALKFIHPNKCSATARDLFQREAQALAQISHPHVVTVHHAGEQDGISYLAMEFVAGGTLAERLKSSPLEPKLAARLVSALAHGMTAVHALQILHRDLKPHNVLLVGELHQALEQCTPKIADFGLAKKLDHSSSLAQTEGGTAAYMAPEQIRGALDKSRERTDIYGLGAILYECLTGRPPFVGSSAQEIMHQVLQQDPIPPRHLNHEVPEGLQEICLTCLRKNWRHRYGSTAALADDLQRFLAEQQPEGRPVRLHEKATEWARRRPVVAMVLAVLIVVAIVAPVLAFAFNRQADENRKLAEENETKAIQNGKLAAHNGQLAEDNAKKASDLQKDLIHARVREGIRLMDTGSFAGALAWFADALERSRGSPERELMHRYRIAALLRQTARLERVWNQPQGTFTAEFSPDGRYVVLAGADGTVQVREVLTGEPVGLPLHHDRGVLHARFSRDSRFVTTACQDGTASVWRVDTAERVRGPLAHDGLALKDAVLSPNGKRLVTVAFGVAWLWDLDEGRLLGSPLRHMENNAETVINAVAFSPDGKLLVTCGGDGSARLWDTVQGRALARPLRHQGEVTHASFMPGYQIVLTASADRTARFWNTTTGQEVWQPLQHERPVTRALFSFDSLRIVTTTQDGGEHIWRAQAKEGNYGVETNTLGVNGLIDESDRGPDMRRYVRVDSSASVRLWDSAGTAAEYLPFRHTGKVHRSQFTSDGRYVLTLSGDDRVAFLPKIWELTQDKEILRGTQKGPFEELLALSFSADGRKLLVQRLKSVQIEDTFTGERIGQPLNVSQIHQGQFDGEGRRVLTVSNEARVQVWDATTGMPIGQALDLGGPGYAILSPNGGRVVTQSATGVVKLWDINTGEATVVAEQELRWSPTPPAFSPDGKRVLAASDRVTQVYDVQTGREVGRPMEHLNTILHQAFQSDGRKILTASKDYGARIWDAATGEPLTPLMVHADEVTHAVFSPDGLRVATAANDDTARVWDAATGEPLTPALNHRKSVRHVAFSPDGRLLVTSSFDQTAQVWDVSADERDVEDLIHLAQLMADGKIKAPGDMVNLGAGETLTLWQTLREKYPQDFRSSENEELSWHRREEEDCKATGHWQRRLLHLDRLLHLRPEDWATRKQRADLFWEKGEWEKAAQDYEVYFPQIPEEKRDGFSWWDQGWACAFRGRWEEAHRAYRKVVELKTNNIKAWHEAALVCLQQDDIEGYRNVCREAKKQFTQPSPAVAARLLSLASLHSEGPAQMGNITNLVEIIKPALNNTKEAYPLRLSTAAFGLRSDLKNNNRERVQPWTDALESARKAHGEGTPQLWLFLALGHHHQGHDQEAKDWLNKVAEWRKNAEGPDRNRVAWFDRLEVELLEKDVREEIK